MPRLRVTTTTLKGADRDNQDTCSRITSPDRLRTSVIICDGRCGHPGGRTAVATHYEA